MSDKTVYTGDVSYHLIQDIRQIINCGRAMAYASVNGVMIDSYWKIGQRIVEEEQHGSKRAEYGTGLLKKLAKVLSAEFGNNYDSRNLRNFRQFYLCFPDIEIWNAHLSWTHFRSLLRVPDSEQLFAAKYLICRAKKNSGEKSKCNRKSSGFSTKRMTMTSVQKIHIVK